MNQKKIRKLLAAFSVLGLAMTAALECYMLRMSVKYPQVEAFSRNVRIAGVLLAVWLAVSAYLVVQAFKSGE